MATNVTRPEPQATSSRHRYATHQAYMILRTAFVVAPILFGLDKFPNLLVQWDQYLAPAIVGVLPVSAHAAMYAVGVVEVLAGLPRPVGLLAAPAGVDQVLVGALQGAQQLEPLEALGLLDRARPAAEPLLETLLLVRRHGDGIDLHDAHAAPLPGPADTQSRMLEG